MRRDLRHLLWFMAALMPIMIAATLLTSGVGPNHERAHLRGGSGNVVSVREPDAAQDAALYSHIDRDLPKPD